MTGSITEILRRNRIDGVSLARFWTEAACMLGDSFQAQDPEFDLNDHYPELWFASINTTDFISTLLQEADSQEAAATGKIGLGDRNALVDLCHRWILHMVADQLRELGYDLEQLRNLPEMVEHHYTFPDPVKAQATIGPIDPDEDERVELEGWIHTQNNPDDW